MRRIVHVRLEQPVDPLVRVERNEMAVTCSVVKFEPVRIPNEPDELIRYDNGFDVNAVYVRIAVDRPETILPVDCVIDFGDRIVVACTRVDARVKRAVDGRDGVIRRNTLKIS